MIGATELDLVGIANADSYTLKNDLLRLYSGNKDIYNLRLEVARLSSARRRSWRSPARRAVCLCMGIGPTRKADCRRRQCCRCTPERSNGAALREPGPDFAPGKKTRAVGDAGVS